MFDPERDEDPGARPFYRRLFAVVLISVFGCIALWPSVTAFSAGDNGEHGCMAILNGWHPDKPQPSAAAVAAAAAVIPATPSAAQAHDEQFMTKWRAQWQAAQSSPALAAANARFDWLEGAGACVPESRHRLIESGVGLGTLTVVCGGVAVVRRRRRGRPESPTNETSGPVPTLV